MADYDLAWVKADPGYVPAEIDTTQPSVARFFDGLDLLQPGLVFLPWWRPETRPDEAEPGSTLMLCGVARKR